MIDTSELASFEKRYVCLEANSAEEMQAWITRQHANFRVEPLEEINAGTVAKISRATFDDVALVSYRYNTAFQGDFSAEYDAYFLSLPISGSARRFSPQNGEIHHLPDQLLVYRGLDGLRNVISSDYAHVSLTVPAKLLEGHLRSIMGSELKSPLSFTPLVGLDSGSGRAVSSLVNYIISQFVHHSDPFGNAILSTTMKSYLCTVLLGNLNHNYSSAMRPGSVTAVPRTVKRAEEYMREVCAQAITIEELADVAGCSARSLHAAFKAFRGSTPMSVLC
ncbi:MAG: helix-turn-helix transcriptional regulator, partial [Rhizobiales bacterium]|nr:helix-turn-helix transcriptional regulator [Hyphomicrobiales bacterium]